MAPPPTTGNLSRSTAVDIYDNSQQTLTNKGRRYGNTKTGSSPERDGRGAVRGGGDDRRVPAHRGATGRDRGWIEPRRAGDVDPDLSAPAARSRDHPSRVPPDGGGVGGPHDRGVSDRVRARHEPAVRYQLDGAVVPHGVRVRGADAVRAHGPRSVPPGAGGGISGLVHLHRPRSRGVHALHLSAPQARDPAGAGRLVISSRVERPVRRRHAQLLGQNNGRVLLPRHVHGDPADDTRHLHDPKSDHKEQGGNAMNTLNVVLWSVQGFLALFFLAAGAPKLIGRGMERWTGFSELPRAMVVFIGVTEVLGAAGLVLPMATGVLPWLTPLAAIGLATIVLMATGFHLRADERINALETGLWASIAVVIALGRWDLLAASHSYIAPWVLVAAVGVLVPAVIINLVVLFRRPVNSATETGSKLVPAPAAVSATARP